MAVSITRATLSVSRFKKVLSDSIVLGVIVVLIFSVFVPTIFARSAQYAPGETLNPDCSPGEANCAVLQLTASTTINTFGVGTTSPFAKFSVHGLSSDSNQYLFVIASSTALATTTQLVFTSSGRLGIGTTSPGQALSVGGDILGNSIIGSYFTATTTTASSLRYASSTALTISGTAYFSGSGIWNPTGSVGIGTTSPYAKLSVVGEGVFTNLSATSTTATSTFAGGLLVGGGDFKYDFSSGITSIDDLQTGPMTFDTNAGIVAWIDLPVTSTALVDTVESYSARIDGNSVLTVYGESNGSGGTQNRRVGVATTSPWRTFSVNGTVSFANLTTPDVAGSFALCLDPNTNEVYNSAASTCTVSSARFKHNIESVGDVGLSIINRLRPVTFNLNTNNESHYGFIAEEVVQVDDRLIFTERGSTTPRGVRYEEVTAVLAKAIQEQQVQINRLNAQTGLTTTSDTRTFILDTLRSLGVIIDDAIARFRTVFVQTLNIEDKLCVDDVCLGKEELKTLLRNAGGTTTATPASTGGTASVSEQTGGQSESTTETGTTATSTESVLGEPSPSAQSVVEEIVAPASPETTPETGSGTESAVSTASGGASTSTETSATAENSSSPEASQ
ncbi:tail fiber domain-containing protein [Patescibacteria group bacterium]|nr:MAG: tail fiber domain-containing protein [Patescibacteria group bacterium]